MKSKKYLIDGYYGFWKVTKSDIIKEYEDVYNTIKNGWADSDIYSDYSFVFIFPNGDIIRPDEELISPSKAKDAVVIIQSGIGNSFWFNKKYEDLFLNYVGSAELVSNDFVSPYEK